MKVTNGEILEAKGAIDKLKDKPLPIRASLGIAQLARKLNEHMENFATVRDGLQKQYGVKFESNKENHTVTFVSEVEGNAAKFAQDLNELIAQEVEIVFTKIKLPEKLAATCDACKHNMDKPLEIEPSVMQALEKFIEIL